MIVYGGAKVLQGIGTAASGISYKTGQMSLANSMAVSPGISTSMEAGVLLEGMNTSFQGSGILMAESMAKSGDSGGTSGKPSEGAGQLAEKFRNIGDDILDAGHTVEKHVAQTNQDLIKRAFQEGVDASSFTNQSANYADMESLVIEFNEIESDNYVNSIKEELSKVKKNQTWNEFTDIAYSSGGRLIQPEKCEEFVNNLIRLFKK